MAKCKVHMTADDLKALQEAISSVVRAQSASENMSFRQMLVDHSAALGRLEVRQVELVVNKRKFEQGEERLQMGKRMVTRSVDSVRS